MAVPSAFSVGAAQVKVVVPAALTVVPPAVLVELGPVVLPVLFDAEPPEHALIASAITSNPVSRILLKRCPMSCMLSSTC